MTADRRKLYYKIGEACRALDIQPYVLRYWETEFPVLAPNKSKSGQRVYAERELTVIRRIKELLYDEGYTIAGAKKKLENELSASPSEEASAAAPAASRAGKGRTSPLDAPPTATVDESVQAPELPAQSAPEAGPAGSSKRSPQRPAGGAERRIRERRQANLSLPLGVPLAPPRVPPLVSPLPLDTHDAQRIETWRQGIEAALSEARDILAVLGTKHRI